MRAWVFLILLMLFAACRNPEVKAQVPESGPYLQVLGTAQDAGWPQIGCRADCCATLLEQEEHGSSVVSIGLVDTDQNKSYLLEATPDISRQLEQLQRSGKELPFLPEAIFLTHAHIGHYTGLMFLGKEALNAESVKVYAMPRLLGFLNSNGPWDLLVANANIKLESLQDGKEVDLGTNLSITPLLVPHRDEYSETVGFLVKGPQKKALFIPDIDKWERWDQDIVEWVSKVDLAFLDATFFNGEELPNRDISQVPHPFVEESLRLFDPLPASERNKIHFIHLNHSNPLLDPESPGSTLVDKKGFHVAREGDRFQL